MADLEELVRQHHEGLLRLAFVVCGDPAEAEDLVAEAYARSWPRLAGGQVDDPLAYLRRAVVNGSASWRRRRILVRREERRHHAPPAASDPTSVLAERDRLAMALQQLPVAHRQVLGLRFVADLSEADTAAALGVPAGTVKSRTARALDGLRELLGAEDDRTADPLELSPRSQRREHFSGALTTGPVAAAPGNPTECRRAGPRTRGGPDARHR